MVRCKGFLERSIGLEAGVSRFSAVVFERAPAMMPKVAAEMPTIRCFPVERFALLFVQTFVEPLAA